MKKIFTLITAFFMIVCGASAKNVITTTTLWEDTYTDNIVIPASSLAEGVTITVYMTVTNGTQLRAFYCLNNSNQDQKSFINNGGTIEDWKWQNAGTESYSFTIGSNDMNILNNTTEETGSTGNLFIGSADAEKLTITKITKTVTSTEDETSTTTIWNTGKTLGQYDGVDLGVNLSTCKKGDVFRVTATNAGAGNLLICNANGWGELMTGSTVAQTEAQTVDFEITSATILEKIQQNGIVVKTEASAGVTITQVELLTYASSYDCVPATIGSVGIATFSSSKDLDFSTTGVTPYYASAVSKGTVTLTATTNATTWNFQGYIIKGDEGTYDVPVTAGASYPAATYLKGQTSEGTVTASTTTTFHYIFAKHNDEIGFYKLTADHTLAAHKAYLETTEDITPSTSSDPAGTRGVTLDFGDGTTAILPIENDGSSKLNLNEDGVYYTLQGTRVQSPTKGLYILNGKKVLVK